MSIKLFGVYLARFQYLETNAYKIRPVVIVGQPNGPHKIVLVVPLSSKASQVHVDTALLSWQKSGLAKPTVARVHRLTALPGNNILEVIGHLETQDATKIKQALRQILEL